MLNLANKITLTRILLTPLVIVLLTLETPFCCFLATIVFILISLTDLVDGWVARRHNLVTSIGKFLDPLADKVLICSVLIMLVELQWLSAWIVIIIVCRELIVTGLRAMAVDKGIILAADTMGKAKTVMQIIAIIPLMLHYPVYGINLHILGQWLILLALLLSLSSGINYCYMFYRTVKQVSKV